MQDSEGVDAFCNTFLQLLPRVSHLHLEWNDGQGADDDLRYKIVHLMGLEELTSLKSLEITDWNEDSDRLPNFIIDTPALTKFVFGGDFAHMPRVSRNVTDFDCDCADLGPREMLALLSRHPQLEILDISNADPPAYVERGTYSVVSLPKLKSLCVRSFLPTDMNDLIKNLHVPSWRTMRLSIFLDESAALNHPQGEWGIEEFLGHRLFSFDGIIFFQKASRFNFYYTLTTKSGQEMHVKFKVTPGPRTPIASLSKLSSYPNTLTSVTFDIPKLPTTFDLTQALSSWSNITCIQVRTEKTHFVRLLKVLEQEPEIICPLLEVLDCNGTVFQSSRLSRFLRFRKRCGKPLHQLRVGFGVLDTSTMHKFQALVGEVDEVQTPPQPSYRDMKVWGELRELYG